MKLPIWLYEKREPDPEQAVEEGLSGVGPSHIFYRRRGRRVLGLALEVATDAN